MDEDLELAKQRAGEGNSTYRGSSMCKGPMAEGSIAYQDQREICAPKYRFLKIGIFLSTGITIPVFFCRRFYVNRF